MSKLNEILLAAIAAAWEDGWKRAAADGRPQELSDGAVRLMAEQYAAKEHS